MLGGLITQQATIWLQRLGFVCGLLMAWNAWIVSRLQPRFGLALAVWTAVLGLSLVGLVGTHAYLDNVIDIRQREVIDYDAFAFGHRTYNQLTTLEWVASIGYLVTTVIAWRDCDRREHRREVLSHNRTAGDSFQESQETSGATR